MGKCMSKDKNGGATAPAKPNGTCAHITVRELRQEHFPADRAGRKQEAASIGRAVPEKQFKNPDVKEEQPIVGTIPGKGLGSGNDLGRAVQQGGVRSRENGCLDVMHSVELERKAAVPDVSIELNTVRDDAKLAPALVRGSESAGGSEKRTLLPPDLVLKSSPTGCVLRGEQRFHSKRPSMSSTEFAGHFSDFDCPTATVVEPKALAQSADAPAEDLKSPSSSPVKSVKESASVKASVVVKRTPTKSEGKPTKSGRYALKDISMNAPLKREQASKRQLPKSSVLEGLDASQDPVPYEEQVAKSIPSDFKRSRSAKRSKDWGTQPDDIAVITSGDDTEAQAPLATAAQHANTSSDVNVDSSSKKHLSAPASPEDALPFGGNVSVSATLSTSATIASTGAQDSSAPIPLSTAAACDEGWLMSSLISDQEKGKELPSKNLGSLEFPSLDGQSHNSQGDGSEVALENIQEFSHLQDAEASCSRVQKTDSCDLLGRDRSGNADPALTSVIRSMLDVHQSPNDRNEGKVNITVPCDTSKLPVQGAGDSGVVAGGAGPSEESANLDVSSRDPDVGKQELEAAPNRLTQEECCDEEAPSRTEEPVPEDQTTNQEPSSPSGGEQVCHELTGKNMMEQVCQDVPTYEDVNEQLCPEVLIDENVNAQICEGTCISQQVTDHGCQEDMELIGPTAPNEEKTPESSVEGPVHAVTGAVSSFQLGSTDVTAKCIEQVGECGSLAATIVASSDPKAAEPELVETQPACLEEIKMVDVQVSGSDSSRNVSSSQIEGLELTIEVVNDLDERAGIWSVNCDVLEVDKPEAWGTVTGLVVDDASEVNKERHDDSVIFQTVSHSIPSLGFSSAAFGSPLQQCEVNKAGLELAIPSPTVPASGANSSRYSSGAFGSPFKKYMSTELENDEADQLPISQQANSNDVPQEPEQSLGSAKSSLGFDEKVPIDVTISLPVDTEGSPAVEVPPEPASTSVPGENATIVMPSPNKIPVQPSSDSFLVKLPPVSKRTAMPFIPRPPRPEKKITESQVADLLSSFSDRPQRLSSSAPSSPQGPIFDLSQYSLPSTPGDSCPRRSSVDSRGSEGLIFDLSQFSLPSTPLSMSARSSPMSHSSTPRKLGHANAIALTPEEIAEIWGAFELGSHSSSPAAV